MKILKKSIQFRDANDTNTKDSSGFITFIAEGSDDMYHLYNIITRGDTISGSTIRNVNIKISLLYICVYT